MKIKPFVVKNFHFFITATGGKDEPFQPIDADFKRGMSRGSSLKRCGEPSGKQEMVKSGNFMLGPIEDLWQSLDADTTVEIWRYPLQGWTIELYCLNRFDILNSDAFSSDGALY